MKKKFLLLIAASAVLFFGCVKYSTLPSYTTPIANNFTVTSMKHTADSVHVGDTIYLNVAGTMYDTLSVYAYLTIKSTATGSPVYSVGSSSSPIKLNRVLGSANVSGVNTWTSTIMLTGVTSTSKSKLTISANFIYQLSLSSEGGGLATATDAGIANKTVYVQ